MLDDSPPILPMLADLELPDFIGSPLAMGVLAGRITGETQLCDDDVRGIAPEWLDSFRDGRPRPEFMDRVDAVRDILGEGDRTMVQGAIGWLWARSPWAIPIPGFRTVTQVEQNAAAREKGALSPEQMVRVDLALGRTR